MIAVVDDRDSLRLEGPDGTVCMTLTVDDAGPRLAVHAQSVEISAEHEMRLSCQRLDIDVAEDLTMRAGGVVATEGFSQIIRAHRGDVDITANDDVHVDGERIHLNSPYLRPGTAIRGLRHLRGEPECAGEE